MIKSINYGRSFTAAIIFSTQLMATSVYAQEAPPSPLAPPSTIVGMNKVDAENLLRQLGALPVSQATTPGGGVSNRSVELPIRSYSGPVRDTALVLKPGTGIPVNLSVGSAKTLILPGDFDRATLVIPDVAEIIAISQNRVQVMARQPGNTDIVFVNSKTGATFRTHVMVSIDASPVQAALNSAMPRERITATSINNSIVLGGVTRDMATAAQATAIARRFVVDPANGVVNNIQVLGAQQVMLRVKVAEVSRNVVRQFGMNTSVKFNSNNLGNSILSNASGVAGVGNTATGFDTIASVANPIGFISAKALGGILNTTLNALESDGLVKLLAEPNLVAISGQTASFLAGQQYPIPVVGLNGTGGAEYRNLGVSLAFTPTVLSSDSISLQVMTELSTLGENVAIPSGNGVAQVPIFNTRRATTTVEIPSGGSIAIAGLIQSSFQNSLAGLPGIKNIPILGRLFSSTNFQRNETELVIIVTPYLVEAVDAGNKLGTPGDALVPPNDMDLYFLSRLTGANSRRPAPLPPSLSRNIGFITE